MYLRESGIRHHYASVVGVAVHAAGPGWGPGKRLFTA